MNINNGAKINDLIFSRNIFFYWMRNDYKRLKGPVHTSAFSFENAYFFIRFRLPSTLIRSKTEVYVCENGGFRKRSLEWRFLKTEVQRLSVYGRKRRFSVFMRTGDNGGFRKRLRHWHWHVPVKKNKTDVFLTVFVGQCGRSKTLQKR